MTRSLWRDLPETALGWLPLLAFFAWIERSCSLPWVGYTLIWPWVHLADAPVWTLAAFDLLLLSGFGSLFMLRAIRTRGVIAAGVSAFFLMSLWQNTGVVLWALELPVKSAYLLSATVYGTLLYWAGLLAWRRSKLKAGPTGFARLWQPASALFLLALVAAPVMTLDRALVAAAFTSFLALVWRLRKL